MPKKVWVRFNERCATNEGTFDCDTEDKISENLARSLGNSVEIIDGPTKEEKIENKDEMSELAAKATEMAKDIINEAHAEAAKIVEDAKVQNEKIIKEAEEKAKNISEQKNTMEKSDSEQPDTKNTAAPKNKKIPSPKSAK